MTTLKLKKTMDLGGGSHDYYITLFGSKSITETLDKADMITFALPFTDTDWARPSSLQPLRAVLDMLSIKRTFSFDGEINLFSTDEIYDYTAATHRVPKSAPEVRDLLNTMINYGGPVTFFYGVPTDYSGASATGYSSHSDNMYYTSVGFECYITKIALTEEPKGAAGQYRSESTEKQDSLNGSNQPIQGTYFLPSYYIVSLDLIKGTANY